MIAPLRFTSLLVVATSLFGTTAAAAEESPSSPVFEITATPDVDPAVAATESTGPTDPAPTPKIRFLSRMAESEKMASGVHELTAQETANLENLVAYEVASARAGGVNGFAGTFSSRRSPAELNATGIDRMSEDQRESLDLHIAGYIADIPPVPYLQRRGRSLAGSSPTTADLEGKGPLLDVHGEITLTVGGSSQGTFYGGEMTTIISDPKGRFNASISIGTMRGNVPYYYDDYYDRRGPYRLP